MFKKVILTLAFSTALVWSSLGALAKDTPSQAFIKRAIRGNLSEVALGQLAQQKGGSDAVKNFGRQLETDHGAANQKATSVASAMSVTPPAKPGKKQQETYDKLAKLSGPEFDREFVKHAVEDHQKDIAAYERATKRQDQATSYASETLPSLQKHLEAAKSLEGQVKTQ